MDSFPMDSSYLLERLEILHVAVQLFHWILKQLFLYHQARETTTSVQIWSMIWKANELRKRRLPSDSLKILAKTRELIGENENNTWLSILLRLEIMGTFESTDQPRSEKRKQLTELDDQVDHDLERMIRDLHLMLMVRRLSSLDRQR